MAGQKPKLAMDVDFAEMVVTTPSHPIPRLRNPRTPPSNLRSWNMTFSCWNIAILSISLIEGRKPFLYETCGLTIDDPLILGQLQSLLGAATCWRRSHPAPAANHAVSNKRTTQMENPSAHAPRERTSTLLSHLFPMPNSRWGPASLPRLVSVAMG